MITNMREDFCKYLLMKTSFLEEERFSIKKATGFLLPPFRGYNLLKSDNEDTTVLAAWGSAGFHRIAINQYPHPFNGHLISCS